MNSNSPLLDIHNLTVAFPAPGAPLYAVDGISLHVGRGEVLGIVGESGSGKSVGMMAVLGLIDSPGQVSADALRYDGQDLLGMSRRERRGKLGGRIAMIFQDPAACLDPCYTIGDQLIEVLREHAPAPKARLRERALELLAQVEIPDPQSRMSAYPHQMSGGMCQRIMIALALASDPELLIADEPTTALDVTIQAQVVALLKRLQRERNMALVMISHDLALISEVADRVAVMYAGRIVEASRSPEIFQAPRHPYTRALMAALPESSQGARRLTALPGVVPGRLDRPTGCLLAPRCAHADARCHARRPGLEAVNDSVRVACLRTAELYPEPGHAALAAKENV